MKKIRFKRILCVKEDNGYTETEFKEEEIEVENGDDITMVITKDITVKLLDVQII